MKNQSEQGFFLRWSDFTLDLRRKTNVMGVLNVTPDSFSDGGHFFDQDRAVAHALDMVAEGADIIDVGGESTRPYAEEVSLDEEMNRVIPVIERIAGAVDVPISIDTYKSEVAREALRAGASIINDISALRFDPDMAPVAAKAGVPVILMHMQGTPGNMQNSPIYEDVIRDVIGFLKEAVARAIEGGIAEDMILLDPGIGFGKTYDHNLILLRDLNRLLALESPLVLGTSNKAFIGHILNREPHERDTGTMATVAAAVLKGAHIVRVHNVKKAVETVTIIDAIKRGRVNTG